MAAVSTCTVLAWNGLEGLERELATCARLFETSELDPLCNSPGWMLDYARSFVDPETIFGWTVIADDAPIALFAFREEPGRRPLHLRRALFLADGTFDSDYLGFWVHPAIEDEALEVCLDALATAGRCQAVVLAGIPDVSPVLPALRRILDARGLPRRERPTACLSAPLPESFTAYLSRLKPRMRSKVRSVLRTAKAEGARFAWCNDERALADHLQEMFTLHERRRRAAGETGGAFADLPRRAFYRRVAKRSLQDGSLRFARLLLGPRRVAYQLGVVAGGRYYQMQEGYDPDLGDLRVGVALRALAIENLIAEGVRHYDFMAGDSRHKRDWGGEPRPCTTVAFALPRWRARLAYGLRALLDRRG